MIALKSCIRLEKLTRKGRCATKNNPKATHAPGIRSNFKMANCHWMPLVSHMNFDQLRKCARAFFVTTSKMPARALTPFAFCPFRANFFSSTLKVLQSVCGALKYCVVHFSARCARLTTIFSKFERLDAHLFPNCTLISRLCNTNFPVWVPHTDRAKYLRQYIKCVRHGNFVVLRNANFV